MLLQARRTIHFKVDTTTQSAASTAGTYLPLICHQYKEYFSNKKADKEKVHE